MRLHALIYTFSYALTALIGIVTLSALTHLLTPTEYSVYSTSVSFVFFLSSVLFSWVRFSAGRLEAEAIGRVSLWFWLRCFAATVPVAISVGFTGYALGYLSALAATGIAALSIGQGLFDLSQEFRRARRQSRMFTAFSLVRSFLSIAIVVPIAYYFANGALITLAAASTFLLAAAGNVLSIARQPKLETRTYELRHVLSFGAALAASGLLFSSTGIISRLFVVHFLGIDAAGPYNASLDIAGQTTGIFAQSVASVVAPPIFRAYSDGDQKNAVENFHRGSELLLAAILPTTAGLILVTSPLVRVMTGSQFHSAMIEIMPIIIIGSAINNFSHYYLHIAFQLTHRPVFQVMSGLCQLLILISASLLIIPSAGLIGAAYAFLIMNLLTLLVTALFARRTFPIPMPWAPLCKIGVGVLVMAVVVRSIPALESPLIELVYKATAGAIVFATAAFALDVCGIRRWCLAFMRKRLKSD